MKRFASQGVPFDRDFAKRVAEARGRLSRNDQRVIEYIREHIDDLAFHTSDSLSSCVGVSRAAVIRLAQRLGYDGFTQLRNSARDHLQGRQTLTTRFTASWRTSLVEKKFEQDVENLHVTKALVKDDLHDVAAKVSQAPVVYIVGNRETYGLALYLHRMLQTIRPNVRLVDPSFPDEVSRARADDLVIACLFRRYSSLTVSLLASANAVGAQTVVVTDGGANEFADHADYVIVTATESPTLYWSMVAPVAVLETLIAEVAAIDPDTTRLALDSTEQFTREHKIFWSSGDDSC